MKALHFWGMLTFAAGLSFPILIARAANPSVEDGVAKRMEPYTETIRPNHVKFEMLPIPGGKFTMGSPEVESGRKADEGPQHPVDVAPFWMGKYEVTWDEFEIFMLKTDFRMRQEKQLAANRADKLADALARPSAPYIDMSYGMGKSGYPAIAMSQFAARLYCQWLSTKTGHYYRLPTEAEWEYACRAGTQSAYSFGKNFAELDEYAWYFKNSGEKSQKVGTKKANRWGLHDMHGNVSEWCLDQYTTYSDAQSGDVSDARPVGFPRKRYPTVVRGGSWDDDPEKLRSAARQASSAGWNRSDPDVQPSAWYECDAPFVGFRVVRPMIEPTAEEKSTIWDVGLAEMRKEARSTYPGD